MKLITIIGARPQFIKAAAISHVVQQQSAIRELLVHTGQHYDENMSDIFFQELQIPKPAYHLGIGSGMHGAQTGSMLTEIEKVLVHEKPDFVLVYGDTNSTLAGALAAAKLHIPCAHVEAGLRSFNRKMPEEVNRVLTDHVSTLLYPPTEIAVRNLAHEGITGDHVQMVGDVMYDVALSFADTKVDLDSWRVAHKGFALATIHRAENTDDPVRLHAIFAALEQVAQHTPVLLPLHPRTRGALGKAGIDVTASRVQFLAPLGYVEMNALQRHAKIIITDSGGVQKEAFFHRVPCVTLRDETEWVELVEMGWNRLVSPTSAQDIVAGVQLSLTNPLPPVADSGLYGGGQAAKSIVQHLLSHS